MKNWIKIFSSIVYTRELIENLNLGQHGSLGISFPGFFLWEEPNSRKRYCRTENEIFFRMKKISLSVYAGRILRYGLLALPLRYSSVLAVGLGSKGSGARLEKRNQ